MEVPMFLIYLLLMYEFVKNYAIGITLLEQRKITVRSFVLFLAMWMVICVFLCIFDLAVKSAVRVFLN